MADGQTTTGSQPGWLAKIGAQINEPDTVSPSDSPLRHAADAWGDSPETFDSASDPTESSILPANRTVMPEQVEKISRKNRQGFQVILETPQELINQGIAANNNSYYTEASYSEAA